MQTAVSIPYTSRQVLSRTDFIMVQFQCPRENAEALVDLLDDIHLGEQISYQARAIMAGCRKIPQPKGH